MSISVARTPNRLVMAVMLAIALVIMAGSPLAFAGKALCRSDPIVTLTNGDTVDLYADLETDITNVASVDYVLHGPAGVSVVSVIFPNPLTAPFESFNYVADGTSAKYTATTTAQTIDGTTINVTAYMDAIILSKIKFTGDQVNGTSGQDIQTEVRRR